MNCIADFLGSVFIAFAFVLLLMAWVVILATPLKGKSLIRQVGIVAMKVLVVSCVVEWVYLAYEIHTIMGASR